MCDDFGLPANVRLGAFAGFFRFLGLKNRPSRACAHAYEGVVVVVVYIIYILYFRGGNPEKRAFIPSKSE